MAALVAGEKARMYALGGVARGGATRGGYHSPKVFVAINGVHYATARAVDGQQVDNETLTITWARPNRCSFQMRGVVVADGAEVVATMGTKNTLTREFAGNVLNRTVGYVGSPANTHHEVNAIDFSWALNARKVTKRYTNMTGTAIGTDLIATFAAGYTATQVEAGLLTLDEITFTDQDLSSALDQLAKRLGAAWYIDFFRDLHLFTSEPLLTDPRPLLDGDTPHLQSFSATFDASQFISRVFVEGGGVNALAAVVPGETILPVDDVVWYEAAGGLVTSGPQRIQYTGRQAGGSGSLVGPGAAPGTAPSLALAVGTTLGTGLYGYGYTDVTAAGESLPSPLGSVTTVGQAAAPTVVPSLSNYVNGGYFNSFTPIGEAQIYAYTYSTKVSQTDYSEQTTSSTPGVNWTTVSNNDPLNPTRSAPVRVTVTYSTNPLVKTIQIYLFSNESGGVVYRKCGAVANNSSGGTVVVECAGTTPTSQAMPGSNTSASGRHVALSGVAIGASGTTSRIIYRTAVGGAQLKLLTTLADNTTTTYADSTADGSLGANVPTSDTSGLTQPAGQINAGSTSLLTASAGPFSATGGWARLGGDQTIRYTGISGNTLTGIPASGPGAILTTVLYGSQVVAAPALTGIPASGTGSIVYTIKQGDPVNLVAQVDDLAAQAVLAALLSTATYTHDGIIEDALTDNRLSFTEATARGQARLALRNQIDVRAQLVSHDMNLRLGRDQAVTLADLGVDQVFKVQSVTVSGFTPNLPPYYDAVLSSDLFSFEDLLRLARKEP